MASTKSINDEIKLLGAIRDTFEVGMDISALTKYHDKILSHPSAKEWSFEEYIHFLQKHFPSSIVMEADHKKDAPSSDSKDKVQLNIIPAKVSPSSSPQMEGKFEETTDRKTEGNAEEIKASPQEAIVEDHIPAAATASAMARKIPMRSRRATRQDLAITIPDGAIPGKEDRQKETETRMESRSSSSPSSATAPYASVLPSSSSSSSKVATVSGGTTMRTRSSKRKESASTLASLETTTKEIIGEDSAAKTGQTATSYESTPASSPVKRLRRTSRRL